MDPFETSPIFEDRHEAGVLLAEALRDRVPAGSVVVGLARGGVVVAAAVAEELELPLDAVAVRKIGHPLQPEYALGAVAAGGPAFIRARDGLTAAEVEHVTDQAADAARLLDTSLHADRPAVDLDGRCCVLVDDGLATGATMVAAVGWARAHRADRVVVAAPVGAAETVAALRKVVDDVVVIRTPARFRAVGVWYRDFGQVDDDEVVACLRRR